ncbi:RluA family pseudouridine synthase, partial [Streptococcus danieliae]|nr:RluA family pseudouridine synthase [Streptococcus danieliae]
MKKKIIHYRENKDIRIDKYLMTELTEISRTVIQNLINEKYILVNNLPIKSNYKLKKNDEINIIFRPEEELDIKKQDIPLNIVYEDEDLLIVNKEKGMVVHPAVGHRDGTLVNALMFRSEKLSSINGIIRPGIVHRI